MWDTIHLCVLGIVAMCSCLEISTCGRPWLWPRPWRLGPDLGLVILASASEIWPHVTSQVNTGRPRAGSEAVRIDLFHFLARLGSFYKNALYKFTAIITVIVTSASDWLERLIPKMTYNVLMVMLNLLARSLTHSDGRLDISQPDVTRKNQACLLPLWTNEIMM